MTGLRSKSTWLVRPRPVLSGWIGLSTTAGGSAEKSKWTFSPESFSYPRPLVIDQHVVQGQTCSDIARRLGAPFEVVAQQMLDALLLPAIPVVVRNGAS